MTLDPETTMQLHATAMTGPEFLEAVAHAERGNGNDINAEAYELRAREWARDRQALQHLRDENEALSTRIAEAQRVMRGV
jgi:hypothetical protein